ncbi:MAG: DUF3256 family protein [Duncaniella sp.]|nr:DUF3256 family protein [Duncaniella sp.]
MRHLFTIMFALIGLGLQAATAADAFVSAPSSVFPLLDKNTRLDMLDYFRNGLSTPSNNLMQGTSVITALEPASVKVKMTDSSTAQVVVLPAGSDTVIALISTVATPGLDSTISFYDKDWRPLDNGRYFSKPGWKEWIQPGGNMDDVIMQTPFMLASYDYDPASSTLTLTNNLSKFLDADIYDMISGSLRPKLTYLWTGKKFDKR